METCTVVDWTHPNSLF